MARENAWKKYDEQALCALEEISKKYRGFLNDGKTERECVSQTVALKRLDISISRMLSQRRRALSPVIRCM